MITHFNIHGSWLIMENCEINDIFIDAQPYYNILKE